MQSRWILQVAFIITVICVGNDCLWSQQTSPDTILYNGKIVTVDNHGVNDNLGTVAQALAIRANRIVAVGSNSQIQALAASNTRRIDLRGKTVLPGFAGTHDHPMDWDTVNPNIVQKVVTDDIHIERFFNVSPDEVVRNFPQVLTEAVRSAKPGQWIKISVLFGREYQWRYEIQDLLGRQVNKQLLDGAAPNNPLVVRAGFTGMVLNQKAIDAVRAFYGDEAKKFVDPGIPFSADIDKTGVCSTCYRYVEQDALYPPNVLQEIYRLGLSWMTGYGMTLNGSSLYTPGALQAYKALDKKGQLAQRFAWNWYWPPRKDFFLDPYFRVAVATVMHTGSHYLWFGGGVPASNLESCSTLPGISPEVKARESCALDPNTDEGKLNRQVTYNFIKAGGRIAGKHTVMDLDVDHLLDIIEQASKDAGMTIEQIREKRHTYDHMAMSPRPDQIPRIKNLGMVLGGTELRIYEGQAEQRFKNYGERALEMVIPRKNLLDAGVMSSLEIDRPIGYTNLTYFRLLYTGITRKDKDGKAWGPQQGVSREVMLKVATIWGGYYAKKENDLGSLEPGKFADLMVLDRDYLTVPVDAIPDIRVLMTMVGGKIEHLVPSLAREIGAQPTGAQVELGGQAAQW